MADTQSTEPAKGGGATADQRALRAVTWFAVAVGLAGVLAYAAEPGGGSFLHVMGVGMLLAGAATLAGGTLGFLFGIPRTLQQDGALTEADSRANGSLTTVGYRVNTNLEQISDWLTKILVGVSLTQLGAIRDGLWSLSAFVAKGLGPQSHGQVFALALLIYFGVLGFLFGYLWTRLFLAGALRLADQQAIGVLAEKVEKAVAQTASTERKLDELQKQSELDVRALNLATRQLNPSTDLPPVAQGELDLAVAEASGPIKVQIFNQAWQARSESWRNDKAKMELTIPLFRSLIECDVERKYHMNHGQLGFALKDKVAPDWEAAEQELSTAIQMRGPWNDNGWVIYELNRAFCRIMLDPAFRDDQPSDPARKQVILADLRIASKAEQMRRIIHTDDVLQQWLAQNGLTEKDVRRSD